MGEIAEMMLDGTMCEGCGEFMDIGGEAPGYPVRCAACGEAPDDSQPEQQARTMTCSESGCDRKFKTHDAYLQHWRAKHG